MRIEQLDAHVKSYKEYLKKKRREHILDLLKDLQRQREHLLLGEHPVPRIHYKLKMVRPVLNLPHIPDKVSFSSNVKLPKSIVNIKYDFKGVHTSYSEPVLQKQFFPNVPPFSLKNFEFTSTKVNIDKHFDSIYKFNGISYVHKKSTLDIKKFSDIELNSDFLIDYSLPKSPNLKLKSAPLNTYTSKITNFFLPTPPIPLKKWAEATLHFEAPSFIYNCPQVNISDFSKQIILSAHFHVISKKLYNEINLYNKANDVTIPQFNSDVKIDDIKLNRNKFPEPDLDFTDVLEKFQRALNEDLSKGE